MADIEIINTWGRAYIIPKSYKGERWIRQNLLRRGAEINISIPSEFVEEMEKELKEQGLEVEVK